MYHHATLDSKRRQEKAGSSHRGRECAIFVVDFCRDHSSTNEQEIDEVIREWKPAPLAPSLSESDRVDHIVVDGFVLLPDRSNEPSQISTHSPSGVHAKVDGKTVVNFTSNDFLGLNLHPEITVSGITPPLFSANM